MFIKKFIQINKTDVNIAGGKGASLGEMTQAGIPVPEGFIILSKAFEEFLEITDLDVEIDAALDEVDINEVHTTENASEKIEAMIMGAKMPKNIEKEILEEFKELDARFVAVRSSATSEDSSTAAWAGQLETYLNTTRKNLIENVKRCWASLFTPRAIFYRFEQKLDKKKILVAVVVQKMIESEEAGIVFSVHPVTQDRNQLIIEAGFGLGEAVVSGQITPDSYVIDKQDWHVIDKNVNEQVRGLYRSKNGGNEWKELAEKGKYQVLNEKEIVELAKLVVKIEKHYGFPVDVEWAIEKGKFYIVQSRPITTLSNKEEEKSIIKRFLNDKKGAEINKQEGNFSLLVWRTLASLQSNPIFDKYYSEYFGSLLLLIEGKRGIGFFDFENYKKSTEVTLNKYLKVKDFQEIKDYKRLTLEINKLYNNYNPKKLSEMSEDELERVIIKSFQFLRDWQVITLFCEALEKEIVKKYFDKLNDKNINFKEFFEKASLQDFNSFIVNRDKCLINFKKRNLYENQWVLASYLSAPKLSDSENLIKDLIKELGEIKKIKHEHKKLQNEVEKNKFLSNEFRKRLSGNLKKLYDFIKLSISMRDIRKEHALKIITVLSNSVREMFFRLNLNEEDILYSRVEDFKDKSYKNKEYSEILFKRKKGVVVYFNKKEIIEEYVDFNKAKNEIFNLMDTRASLNEIRGTSACEGYARGAVKIILSQKDFSKFKEGDILVTSMTRPEFVPLMKKALAVITDEGGITCHAAIISRELGLPCIIGTKNATRVLKDGYLVEVDSTKGIVRIINKGE